MIFNHNGFTYRLDFQHEQFNPPKEVDTQYRGKRLITALTLCVVWERPAGNPPEDEWVFLTGQSKCAVGDQFDKSGARERALHRAVASMDNPDERELRGKILAAYFTRRQSNGGHSKTPA